MQLTARIQSDTLAQANALRDLILLNTTDELATCIGYEVDRITHVTIGVDAFLAPSPPPPSPPPAPPPTAPPPPLGCTLDFMKYKRNTAYQFDAIDQHVDFIPDGNLVMEWNIMETLARKITDSGMDSYFCHEHHHEFQCLDIGAFSTLSNTIAVEDTSVGNVADVSDMYRTFTYTNTTNLFGQLETCRTKTVGDGTLGVFDLAVLLAYIFKDDGYDTLSKDASTVTTVEGRDGLGAMCGKGLSSVEYLIESADQCYLMGEFSPPPPDSPPSPPSSPFPPTHPPSSPFPPTHPPPAPFSPYPSVPPTDTRRLGESFEDLLTRPRPSVLTLPVQEMPLSTRSSAYDIWMRHSLLSEGAWYTINLDTIPLRTYLVVDAKITAKLSNEIFDWHAPPYYDREKPQVMFTRRSETALFESLGRSVEFAARAPVQCSTITTPYSDMNGMYKGEIQLMQDDIRKACQYYLHIWVPANHDLDTNEGRRLSNGAPHLNILYVELSDGRVGHRSASVIQSQRFQNLLPTSNFECYSNTSGTPILLSYMDNNAPLGLSDVLTLLHRNVTNNLVPTGAWNTDMMDACGDWNADARIDFSDVLGILNFMLGSSHTLYPRIYSD